MWADFTRAARALIAVPAFSAAAIAALALSIAANGAIFGLVDALWLRPPGVRNPETLVRVFATTASENDAAWSWKEFQDIRTRATSLEGVAVRGRRGAMLTAADGSQELLLANVVSTNFFELLGVTPAVGTLFRSIDDATLEASPGVVLGYAFWQRRFGGDPSIVGRPVSIGRGNTTTVAVLGVLPRAFRDLEASADRDVWVPPQAWRRISGESLDEDRRDNRWLEMVARRRPEIAVGTAARELEAVAGAFALDHPAFSAGRGARVVNDFDYRLERGGLPAKAMLALVLLVVLISCVNVANLLLARASARSHEVAVRLSLGAPRWRIVRELGAESVLLGASGGLVGLALASWLIRLLPVVLVAPPGMREMTAFQTDLRVIAFTAAVAACTTVLFGLAPAWLGARTDLVSVLRRDAAGRRRGGVLKRILLIAQVAVALVLLCVGADLVRSFVATSSTNIGFERKPLLTLWTTFGNDERTRTEAAIHTLEGLPGVEAVAVAVRAPLSLSGGGLARPVVVAGTSAQTAPPRVKFNAVSSNYFQVLGTRIVRGRPFSADEERGGEAPLVVSEQFARQLLPGRDPLGTVVQVAGSPHRIVGVAQDAVVDEVGEPPKAYMYLPFGREGYGETTFILHTNRDPAEITGAARVALKGIHPGLDPRRAVTMAQYLAYATSLHRTVAALATLLGLVGLVLTAIGVYGVVAYRTGHRTKEIGIRMSLGARDQQVVRLVMRDGLTLGAAGVAVGLPLALAATRLVSSMLVGVKAWDLTAFVAAASILIAAVVLATLIPARRAARIDPSRALRSSAN